MKHLLIGLGTLIVIISMALITVFVIKHLVDSTQVLF